jgi:hypothetical protein
LSCKVTLSTRVQGIRRGHNSIVNARSSAVNWMEVRSQDVTATTAPTSSAATRTAAGAPRRPQMSRSTIAVRKPTVRSKMMR